MSLYERDHGRIIKADGTVVPMDPHNADYKQYLAGVTVLDIPQQVVAEIAPAATTSVAENLVASAVSLKAAVSRAQALVDSITATTAAFHAQLDKVQALKEKLDGLNKQLALDGTGP